MTQIEFTSSVYLGTGSGKGAEGGRISPEHAGSVHVVVIIQREWTTGYARWMDGHRGVEKDGMVIEAGFTVVAILLFGLTPSCGAHAEWNGLSRLPA